MDFGLEVIQVGIAIDMLNYIKGHLDLPTKQVEQLCSDYIKFIKENSFKAYE